MWSEVPTTRQAQWPQGVRLPIIISVHHQSEEAAVVFTDGFPTTATGKIRRVELRTMAADVLRPQDPGPGSPVHETTG